MPTMVEQVREESVVRKGGTTQVGTFQIERNEEGLKIKIKSEMIEKFFKGLSSRTETYGEDRKYYNIRSECDTSQLQLSMDTGEAIYFSEVTKNIVSSQVYYLWFLRMVGLGEGIEIVFPGVYSTQSLKNLHKAIKYSMSYLYLNFIKSYKTSCDLQTIEYYKVDGVSQ